MFRAHIPYRLLGPHTPFSMFQGKSMLPIHTISMGSWSRTLGGSCLIFLISSCRVLLLQAPVCICCSTSISDCSQSPRSWLSLIRVSCFMPTQNLGKSAIALVAKRNPVTLRLTTCAFYKSYGSRIYMLLYVATSLHYPNRSAEHEAFL